jgi:hypothetical protein
VCLLASLLVPARDRGRHEWLTDADSAPGPTALARAE